MDFRTDLPARDLYGVRLAGLVFGRCREGRGLGGFRDAVYRGADRTELDREVLRERS